MTYGWILAAALAAAPQQAQVRGFESLAEGLIDLRWMCEQPAPGESSQALDGSSGDGGAVVLEHGGSSAGLVGRVWCSRRDGVLRVWIDGAPEPALAWDLAAFDASDRGEDLPPDPLAGPLGSGWYCVAPMPFTRAVRVEFAPSGGGATRLQADLRLLGAGAAVEPLGAGTFRRYSHVLRRIARTILDGENPKEMAMSQQVGAALTKQESRVSPSTPWYDGSFYVPMKGSGMLRWWTMSLPFEKDPAHAAEILRALTLRVETGTDLDSEEGRLLFEMPIGDLFGAGAGMDPYRQYLLGLDEDGKFHCRLPMPFSKHLKFVFRYPTRPKVTFQLEFGYDVMPPDQVPPLRLRGGWLLADPAEPSAFALVLPGPARLVSSMWTTECASGSPWTESPAFAFAGGLVRPRPDAWSQVVRRDGPGRFGRYTMLRQFAHDAPMAGEGGELRFEAPSFFRGAPGEARAAHRVLWYGPQQTDARYGELLAPEQRARLPAPVPDFFSAPNAAEGESLAPTAVSQGAAFTVEDWSGVQPAPSRKEVLLFRPAKAADQFAFTATAPVAGEYELVARVGAGPGLGAAAFFLDGKRVTESAGGAAAARGLQEVVLQKGLFLPRAYAVAVRALGAEPVALDCVYFRPVAQ